MKIKQSSNPRSFPDNNLQTYANISTVTIKVFKRTKLQNNYHLEVYYYFPESVSEIKRCVEEPGYLQQQIERYTPELLGRDVNTIVWQKMLAKMPHHGRAHDLLSRLKKKRQPFFNALIATAFLFPQAVGLLSPTFS